MGPELRYLSMGGVFVAAPTGINLGGISGFIEGKTGEAIKLASSLPQRTKIKQIREGEIAMMF